MLDFNVNRTHDRKTCIVGVLDILALRKSCNLVRVRAHTLVLSQFNLYIYANILSSAFVVIN